MHNACFIPGRFKVKVAVQGITYSPPLFSVLSVSLERLERFSIYLAQMFSMISRCAERVFFTQVCSKSRSQFKVKIYSWTVWRVDIFLVTQSIMICSKSSTGFNEEDSKFAPCLSVLCPFVPLSVSQFVVRKKLFLQ